MRKEIPGLQRDGWQQLFSGRKVLANNSCLVVDNGQVQHVRNHVQILLRERSVKFLSPVITFNSLRSYLVHKVKAVISWNVAQEIHLTIQM